MINILNSDYYCWLSIMELLPKIVNETKGSFYLERSTKQLNRFDQNIKPIGVPRFSTVGARLSALYPVADSFGKGYAPAGMRALAMASNSSSVDAMMSMASPSGCGTS